MSNLIAIGGQPAVGKTTIVRQFLINYDNWKIFKFKKLYGHYHKELNLIILGVYKAKELFSGTDRLSMAVQPDFNEFMDKEKPPYNILFEGDRLFNLKTIIKAKQTMKVQVYIVTSKHTNQRHIDRKDTQSDKFIKGRVTKVNNIKGYLIEDYIDLINDEENDINKNYKIILDNLLSNI